MAVVIIPGRHLITSAFMVEHLETLLEKGVSGLPLVGNWQGANEVRHLIIPITSANQHGSRYNPVPLYARLIGLERTLALFREKHNVRISYVPIPHFRTATDFANLTLKYIQAHLAGTISPATSVMWTSTEPLIKAYQHLGYVVLPAEWDMSERLYHTLPPNEILNKIIAVKNYQLLPEYNLLSEATKSVWLDMPEVPEHIARLYTDPLLTDTGSLTENRNYATYSVGMSHTALMDLKFNDIKQAVVEGKIVDEGCADGALMVRLAETFGDSDILGIDITGEFISRVEERQRAGEFGAAFVFVYQRNLLEPIFAPDSIQTTICNSTLHELWSYGKQKESVMGYLREKYRQLSIGGRLVIRDVVGPENKEDLVYLKLSSIDGENFSSEDEALLTTDTARLSTEARFYRFVHDFLYELRQTKRRDKSTVIEYSIEEISTSKYFKMRLKDAVEFLSRKDYHDNWASEMNEEFAFWDFKEWQDALTKVGFNIVHDDYLKPTFSRAYVNKWIVQNRWQPCATIYKKNPEGELVEQPFPVTNMVLVGEKPLV